jgi:hypothetical protein
MYLVALAHGAQLDEVGSRTRGRLVFRRLALTST